MLNSYLYKQLWASLHPITGPYAAVVVLLGFNYYPAIPWVPTVLYALAFVGITWSIMLFNNIIDRKHDKKKGKSFASKHTGLLVVIVSIMSGMTLALLAVASFWSLVAALLCTATWALGFIYSFMRKWVLIQNLVVALCSAAPVMVAAVYHGGVESEQWHLFSALFFLIATKEIYLDIRDHRIDVGYKKTLATEGSAPFVNGFFFCLLFTMAWGLALIVYPSVLVKVAAVLAGIAAIKFSRLFLHWDESMLSAHFVDRVVMYLLPAVFVSQLL